MGTQKRKSKMSSTVLKTPLFAGNLSYHRKRKGELEKPHWIKKEPMKADFLTISRELLPMLETYLQGKLAGYPMVGYDSYSLGEDSSGAEKIQLFRADGEFEDKVAVIVFSDTMTAEKGAVLVDKWCR